MSTTSSSHSENTTPSLIHDNHDHHSEHSSQSHDHEHEEDGIHSDWSPSSNDDEREEEEEEEGVEEYDMLASRSWSEGGISTVESSSNGTGDDSHRGSVTREDADDEGGEGEERMRLSFPDPLDSTPSSSSGDKKDRVSRRSTITTSLKKGKESIDPEDTTDYSFILDTTSTPPLIVDETSTTLPSLLSTSSIISHSTSPLIISNEITPTSSSILPKSKKSTTTTQTLIPTTTTTTTNQGGREIRDISKWIESSGTYTAADSTLAEKKLVKGATVVEKEKRFDGGMKKIFHVIARASGGVDVVTTDTSTQTDPSLKSSSPVGSDKSDSTQDFDEDSSLKETRKIEKNDVEVLAVEKKVKLFGFFDDWLEAFAITWAAAWMLIGLAVIPYLVWSAISSSPSSQEVSSSCRFSVNSLANSITTHTSTVTVVSILEPSTSTSSPTTTSATADSSIPTPFHLTNCYNIGTEACALGLLEFHPNLLRTMLENGSKEDFKVVEEVVGKKKKVEKTEDGLKEKEMMEKVYREGFEKGRQDSEKEMKKKVVSPFRKKNLKGKKMKEKKVVIPPKNTTEKSIVNTFHSYSTFNLTSLTTLLESLPLQHHFNLLLNLSSTSFGTTTKPPSIQEIHQVVQQIFNSPPIHRARKSAIWLSKRLESQFDQVGGKMKSRYHQVENETRKLGKRVPIHWKRTQAGAKKVRKEMNSLFEEVKNRNLTRPFEEAREEVKSIFRSVQENIKIKKRQVEQEMESRLKRAGKGFGRIKRGEVEKHLRDQMKARGIFGKRAVKGEAPPCLIQSKERRWARGCMGFGSK